MPGLREAVNAVRCSRTVRLGKHCRPSGTMATPARAMRSELQPLMSWPAKWILPPRSGNWPNSVRSNVVLPMPFLPSKVTTWPAPICKSTPNSTWLAP
ncbi:hypothetical protein D3C77_693170 [compost metagenome]